MPGRMTVECPRCGTLYRRPSRAEPDGETTYRCARCRHVFEVQTDGPAVVEGDDEGDFAFDDEPDEDDGATEPPAGRPAARGTERHMRTPARFAVRTMLLVTLGYAIVSVYLYTHPQSLHRALGGIPLLGSRLAETPLQPTTVQLSGVQGRYQRVRDDRLVFVISGTAVNDSPLAVRGIQVEGRITGAQEQRQVVFCGAAPRDVQDLSLREIALLQTLEPPKDWSLGPGEQASFLVVFASPPVDLHEFGAEVVAVQATSRRG